MTRKTVKQPAKPKGRRFDMRLDVDFEAALDDIRRLATPVPTKSDAVRQSVMFYREHLRKCRKA